MSSNPDREGQVPTWRDRLTSLREDARAIARSTWVWFKDFPRRLWAKVRHAPKIVQWLLLAVIVLIVGVVIFLANPNWNWARGMVSSMASGRLHRPVQIDGDLRVHLFRWTPDATVNGLKIGQPDWAAKLDQPAHMADVARLSVEVELMPLFIGRVVLPRLEIHQANVALYQDKGGRANWDFSDGAKAGEPTKLPPIKTFIIRDGQVSFVSIERRLTFSGSVNATEKADAGRTAFLLTGNGKLNDKVFELSAKGGPLLNVRTDRPYPLELDVRAGDTRIIATGSLLRPFNLGQLQGNVTVSGSDLADLYYLTGLALPNTSAYKVSAQVIRDDRVYTIKAIDGRVGSSDLRGDLKVELRDKGRPYLTGDLQSRSLNFADLGSLFGATAANTPQGAEVSATPQAAVAVRRLLPDAPLDVQRVRNMDADVRYRAMSVKTHGDLPLRQVTLGVKLDHGLLSLDPIRFSFPQGQLEGTARLDARKAIQTNTVDMRLSGFRIQDILPNVQGAKPLEGLINARLRATGSGSSVRDAAASADGQFSVVMSGGRIRQSLAELMGVNATKGLFLYLSKDRKETGVRCGVANFALRNGVAQSQGIVFDTDVVQLTGDGTVNLQNERLKLSLKGKPKKFRLTRIHAPILIGGSLGAPKFGIDAKPALVQGGLAAAFQTVVPFLNFDYAKDANCAALLRGK